MAAGLQAPCLPLHHIDKSNAEPHPRNATSITEFERPERLGWGMICEAAICGSSQDCDHLDSLWLIAAGS